ncbi:MAG: redoxin family protein [Planctomycetes bacterium]|nr:redoxin family protein [Planctomycetota bacterium]
MLNIRVLISTVLIASSLAGADDSKKASHARKPVDYTLTSAAGDNSLRLSETRGRFVALHFLLKTDCPICARHVQEYVRNAPSVAGVVHLFIKPDSADDIKSWSKMLGETAGKVTLYRDANAQFAKKLKIPDGYNFHNESVHFPALVVLDRDGVEAFRYVGKDTTDRMPFSKFALKLMELSQNESICEYNLEGEKIGLKGHDPVAYFTVNRAEKGRDNLTSIYRGVTYRFVSPENRELFAADPESFMPAYGGWCATAMADGGKKVDIDPGNYKISNNRLLLFYKGWLGNALNDWNKDEQGNLVKADAEWKKIAPHDAPKSYTHKK